MEYMGCYHDIGQFRILFVVAVVVGGGCVPSKPVPAVAAAAAAAAGPKLLARAVVDARISLRIN